MEEYIGTIKIFGFNFAPRGWAMCNGQLLPISQYTALFSLLGTTYGGDGRTTFALPDLRGRAPIGFMQGAGLSNYDLGEIMGTETATLLYNNLPAHNHIVTIKASSDQGDTSSPSNAFFANSGVLDNEYKSELSNPVSFNNNTATTSIAGSSTPFSIMQPIIAVNYCIALEGIFPSRN